MKFENPGPGGQVRVQLILPELIIKPSVLSLQPSPRDPDLNLQRFPKTARLREGGVQTCEAAKGPGTAMGESRQGGRIHAPEERSGDIPGRIQSWNDISLRIQYLQPGVDL